MFQTRIVVFFIHVNDFLSLDNKQADSPPAEITVTFKHNVWGDDISTNRSIPAISSIPEYESD